MAINPGNLWGNHIQMRYVVTAISRATRPARALHPCGLRHKSGREPGIFSGLGLLGCSGQFARWRTISPRIGRIS